MAVSIWFLSNLSLCQFCKVLAGTVLSRCNHLCRDLKQVVVVLFLGPLIFLMNNISAWITAAHNKLMMFKLARHLLRMQTNPIPLVLSMECCSWIFSLKYLWYVKPLPPVKQRSVICSGDPHRQTQDFSPYFLCAKFIYLVVNGCLYVALHFKPHHTQTCEMASLDMQEKEVEGKQKLTVVVRSRYMYKCICKDRLNHISISTT